MRQWLRECQLIGVDAESKGLDFSTLRISFGVKKTTTPTPNEATIRIYNLSVGTAKKAKEEFKRIQLKAGYTGASDIIFDGNIKEARIGRAGTDTHLDIIAGDGDKEYAYANVNKTLEAGYSLQDVFDMGAKEMCSNGISLGRIDKFSPVKFPRARVMHGLARDIMECCCFTDNKSWSIQNMKIQALNHKKSLPNAFVISEDTGMVGVPEEVNEGLRVRCLLNPKLMVDAQVKIESKYISDIAASATGFYRILELVQRGDTHGKPWFSDLVCVAMSGSGGDTTDSEERE